MVHLGPLPGSPSFDGDFDAVLDAATNDASLLKSAGFDALMVENFGDVPFYGDDVPKVTIAAMTRAVAAVGTAAAMPVGVNVLRNDALGALAVAAAADAAFIRVNVLSGVMYTDQGPIVGRAAEVARARKTLAPGVAVMADVFVKHATPPPGSDLAQSAEDLVERGLADAVVVSGVSTAREPDISELQVVRDAIGATPLVIGSGATVDNVAKLLEVADGIIVGSSLKTDGSATSPVDPEKAAAFVVAAG